MIVGSSPEPESESATASWRERGHTFLTAAGFGWSYYYQVWVCLVQRLHCQPSTCVCVDCVVVSAALVVLIVTEDIKVCITSNTSIRNNKIITFSSFQNSLIHSKCICIATYNFHKYWKTYLTLLERGGAESPALFSNVHFSMKKGFWRSKIS